MEAYAVIESGGKQYRVQKGDVLRVELLAGETNQTIQLEPVLAVSDGQSLQVGTPAVSGAKVSASVVRRLRGPKVIAFKKKRRKGFHKKIGHRQELTELKIESISLG